MFSQHGYLYIHCSHAHLISRLDKILSSTLANSALGAGGNQTLANSALGAGGSHALSILILDPFGFANRGGHVVA